MKKFVLKIAFITVGVALVLVISLFGIFSVAMPAAMMDFTASLGLTNISGDYAYQEYERSGSLEYLARSFVIAAENKHYETANERFGLLYGDEGFAAYCEEYTLDYNTDKLPKYDYRAYLCALAARVRYRLATTDEAKESVLDFAVSETDSEFSAGNPVIRLAVEAAQSKDAAFCAQILARMQAEGFAENSDYTSIVTILEGIAHE